MQWRELFSSLAVRPLLEHKLRAALAVLGIACGTALYVAISIINAATIDHFAASVESLAGKSTLSVAGGDTGFPEETLDLVEKAEGVDRVVPIVQARARAGARGEQGVVILGVDMLREGAVRAYKGDESLLDDPLEFLNQVDSVLTTKAFAEEHHLALGSTLTLTTTQGPQTFTVRGILSPTGPAKAFGGRVVFMDIDAARVSFGKEGRTDRLDVLAKKGADVDALSKAVSAAAGPGLRIERPSDQTEAFRKMIAGYQQVLTGLARLALIVAIFLVGNTMAVAVAERRKEIGVLRAIGATRGMILALFLLTAGFLGTTGAALGLPLGRALAAVLVKSVSRSVELTFATPIDVSTLRLPVDVGVLAVVAGALSSLFGGIMPAYRASCVPCVEALRPKDADGASASDSTSIAARVVGVLLLVYVGIASALELDWRSPWLHDSTLTVAYFGGALVAPWISSTVLRALGAVIARTPLVRIQPVNLALASLSSSARRATGSTSLVAALMLVLLMTATHASFKGTLSTSTAKMLTADVWVSENGLFLNGDSAPLREEIKAEIDQVPGVDLAKGGAYAARLVKVRHEGRTIALKAWDRISSERAPIVMMDDAGKGAIAAMFDAERPTALVSENFAAHFGKRRGDLVSLDTPSGPVDFVVAGVMLEFASPEGTVYVSRDTYKRLWRDTNVTMFYAFVASGESPAVVRDRIDAAIGARRGVVTTITEQVRAMSQGILDDAFAYTRAIEAAALVVGLFGLLGTMLVALLERKREIGMLRAIGATRVQVSSMIVVEAALIGIAASATALALGGYLARVWLGGALAHDVGWPIVVQVPVLSVVCTIAAGVVVGMLVGLFGGHRASNVELSEALAYE
ncbi:MAG: ABC transporter permease [Deltaproteobacteria bacterium]|nr:ABC transporter permease [Deltaproteobacteria bacterium]